MRLTHFIDRRTGLRHAGGALWVLGLRPFYLAGAAFGTVAMLLWLGTLAGHSMAGHSTQLTGILWHVHEMIFGFSSMQKTGTTFSCRSRLECLRC